jgi:sodium/potassium-transporting ATPase subunit alpha
VLFAATDLKVDNSSLTGESEPQERFPLADGTSVRPVEADNLVLFSLSFPLMIDFRSTILLGI